MSGLVKAISLWQPHASLWLSKAKVHETRHWATKYRGPLVVHAAKRIVTEVDPFLNKLCVREFGSRWMFELPQGALIGTVDLTDCLPTAYLSFAVNLEDLACGDFGPNRFGWKRGDDYTVFPHAIPYRGMQRIFNVPDELVPR